MEEQRDIFSSASSQGKQRVKCISICSRFFFFFPVLQFRIQQADLFLNLQNRSSSVVMYR